MSRLLRYSGICFFFLFISILAFERSLSKSSNTFIAMVILMYSSVALIFISGLVRVLLSMFGESRVRLTEVLVTLFVAGFAATGLGSAYVSTHASASTSQLQWMQVFIFILCVIWFFMGSTWAWSAAQKLNVEDGKQRLKYLGIGWLLVLGVAGVSVTLFIVFVLGMYRPSSMSYVLTLSICAIPLGIPGFIVQQKVNRLKRAAKV